MPTMHSYDCKTDQATVREMTAEEASAHNSAQAEAQVRLEDHLQAMAQREADIATLATSEDPAHQALSRLLS